MPSVAELVADLAQGRSGDPVVHAAAVRLVEEGRVRLTGFGPLLVIADVDGEEVRLRTVEGALETEPDEWTPPLVAAAILAWRTAAHHGAGGAPAAAS